MIQIGDFKIAGISTSTTRKNSGKAIRWLWEEFYSEHLANQIPHKRNNDIYAVYTDYNLKEPDGFTVLIGYKVNSFESLPDLFTGREFEGGNYERFEVNGVMPKALWEIWENIDSNPQIKRKYTTDFEVYENTYVPGLNTDVELFVSVD